VEGYTINFMELLVLDNSKQVFLFLWKLNFYLSLSFKEIIYRVIQATATMTKFSTERAENEHKKRQRDFREEDAEKIFDKEENLFDKFINISNLKEYLEDFQDLFSLLQDFFRGNYKEVPWLVISSIGGALFYVLSPVDLIPDFIPVVGYLDDAAVFGACLKFVRKDLEQYRRWKYSGGTVS